MMKLRERKRKNLEDGEEEEEEYLHDDEEDYEEEDEYSRRVTKKKQFLNESIESIEKFFHSNERRAWYD